MRLLMSIWEAYIRLQSYSMYGLWQWRKRQRSDLQFIGCVLGNIARALISLCSVQNTIKTDLLYSLTNENMLESTLNRASWCRSSRCFLSVSSCFIFLKLHRCVYKTSTKYMKTIRRRIMNHSLSTVTHWWCIWIIFVRFLYYLFILICGWFNCGLLISQR